VPPLPAKTLLGLLEMYTTAIDDLRALRDPAVDGLIRRLTLHRDELVAALAAVPATAAKQ
jgi:hypothetical protein